jgi:hypothetical protein
VDAGERIASLRGILALVERMGAGDTDPTPSDEALDEAARLSAAYADAPAVSRRRFDALAEDTTAYAAAGIAALMRARGSDGARSAARLLAGEMRRSIAALAAILRAHAS